MQCSISACARWSGPGLVMSSSATACRTALYRRLLPLPVIQDLWRQLREAPGTRMTVDLVEQTVVAPNGARYGFAIDRKERLLKGLDDVGVTLEHLAEIEAFEDRYRKRMTWLASKV